MTCRGCPGTIALRSSFNAMAKTILCFGDSNTWGCVADSAETGMPSARYDKKTRWPRVLAGELGEGYEVIEEGLCGRTSIYTDPDAVYKNAEPYLLPCLLSHRPLDLAILMLGTNDLRLCFHPDDDHLADGVSRLVDIVRSCRECGGGNEPPRILIISPPHIIKPEGRKDFYIARGEEAGARRSRLFKSAYQALAMEKGCYFLDAGEITHTDTADGLHITGESHRALGQAVASAVPDML